MNNFLVEGQRYESPVLGLGASPYIQTNIFIPDYNLNISANGFISNGCLLTVAGHKAKQAEINRFNTQDLQIPLSKIQDLINEVVRKIEETAFTPVQI